MKGNVDVGGANRIVPWIVLALLVTLAYGNAVGNDYVWDDVYFFGDYVWVHDLRTALAAAWEPLFGQRSYVRPLPLLMLYAEVLLSDRNPAVSHAVNLAIHWACGVLVYLIAARSARLAAPAHGTPRWPPLLVASVFIVHPALSEAPIWISSRFDLMATFWVLLALWVAGLGLRDLPRAIVLGVLFLLGALCKESVAIFPFLLGTHALLRASQARTNQSIRLADAFSARELKAYAAILAFGLLYLLIRQQVLSVAELWQPVRPAPAEWVSRVTVSIAKYFQLTVIPFMGSSPHHPWEWPPGATLADFWPAHTFAVLLLGVIATLLVRRRPAGWWLLAWLVAYLPVLHLVPLPIGNNIVHQRFMYLPTAVLLAFAPYVLNRIQVSVAARRTSVALLVVIIAVSIPVTRSIVRVWQNDLTLWTWTTRAQPDSVEARENLVWAYLKHDMFEEAEREFLQVVKTGRNTSPHLAVNMGTAMYRQGEFEGALHYYRKAEPHIRVFNPSFRSRLYANLGITHALLGQVAPAHAYLAKALAEDPRNHTALSHLLAYCRDAEVHPSGIHSEDLRRAQPRADAVDLLLRQHQPALQAEGSFCPPSVHAEQW